MKLMARYKDKHFDLAIVDPPYGILNKTKRGGDYKFNMEEYLKWDVKPSKEFFKELIRVSKNHRRICITCCNRSCQIFDCWQKQP